MDFSDVIWHALYVVLGVMFIGMGVVHFVPAPARGMARMIPPRMRGRGLLSPESLVAFTGVCEIAGGIGLMVPQLRVAAALALVVFLIAVFPANAYASKHPDTFGRAAIPFWPRLAGQVALVAVLLAIAIVGPR
jgi:uncharacterized membrane protein